MTPEEIKGEAIEENMRLKIWRDNNPDSDIKTYFLLRTVPTPNAERAIKNCRQVGYE